MDYKMCDYECLSCGSVEERLVARTELASVRFTCEECGGETVRVLGAPSGGNMAVHIREHEDESTRPSARRPISGPLVRVKKAAATLSPGRHIPGLGRDLGDGYYIPDRKVPPPWEQPNKVKPK